MFQRGSAHGPSAQSSLCWDQWTMLLCEESVCELWPCHSIGNDCLMTAACVLRSRTKRVPVSCNGLKDAVIVVHMQASCCQLLSWATFFTTCQQQGWWQLVQCDWRASLMRMLWTVLQCLVFHNHVTCLKSSEESTEWSTEELTNTIPLIWETRNHSCFCGHFCGDQSIGSLDSCCLTKGNSSWLKSTAQSIDESTETNSVDLKNTDLQSILRLFLCKFPWQIPLIFAQWNSAAAPVTCLFWGIASQSKKMTHLILTILHKHPNCLFLCCQNNGWDCICWKCFSADFSSVLQTKSDFNAAIWKTQNKFMICLVSSHHWIITHERFLSAFLVTSFDGLDSANKLTSC